MVERKVLAVASAGGHWKQMMRLRPAFSDVKVVYVSTLPQIVDQCENFYIVKDANRKNIASFAPQIVSLLKILYRERPTCIVTTGAAPGLIALALGRMLRIDGMWIDSIANGEKLSLSGRLARHVSRLYLTQWPHLAAEDGPFFAGSIL